MLLYGAELSGRGGRARRVPARAPRADAAHALALPVLRRASGGGAVWASQGVLYFALGLRERVDADAVPARAAS